VEIPSIDERIRELCSKAVMAKESELEPILSELRATLREHARFVRRMAAEALNRGSSAKAAD
jgi:hypothetical protein